MIVCPGLTGGSRCSYLRRGLCLGSVNSFGRLGGLLDLDPLLGRGQIVIGVLVPLGFCDRIGSIVRGISVWNDSLCLVRRLVDVSVSQGLVCSGINFGQASVDNGRVRLDMLRCLSGHSFLLAGREQRGRISSGLGFDSGICC